jgi:hypothetical protein
MFVKKKELTSCQDVKLEVEEISKYACTQELDFSKEILAENPSGDSALILSPSMILLSTSREKAMSEVARLVEFKPILILKGEALLYKQPLLYMGNTSKLPIKEFTGKSSDPNFLFYKDTFRSNDRNRCKQNGSSQKQADQTSKISLTPIAESIMLKELDQIYTKRSKTTSHSKEGKEPFQKCRLENCRIGSAYIGAEASLHKKQIFLRRRNAPKKAIKKLIPTKELCLTPVANTSRYVPSSIGLISSKHPDPSLAFNLCISSVISPKSLTVNSLGEVTRETRSDRCFDEIKPIPVPSYCYWQNFILSSFTLSIWSIVLNPWTKWKRWAWWTSSVGELNTKPLYKDNFRPDDRECNIKEKQSNPLQKKVDQTSEHTQDTVEESIELEGSAPARSEEIIDILPNLIFSQSESQDVKVNQKGCFLLVGWALEKILYLCSNKIEEGVTMMVDSAKRLYQKVRPGRCYPRKSKRPPSKWVYKKV